MLWFLALHEMWLARRLPALVSLRAFVGPFLAVEAQIPSCGVAQLNDAAQWQQTRGMAVPKRKARRLSLYS